jgi:hypothetical protein
LQNPPIVYPEYQLFIETGKPGKRELQSCFKNRCIDSGQFDWLSGINEGSKLMWFDKEIICFR